jgi:hypothetical protein
MDFVQAVKDFARANYNKDGWDYVVECWADDEIAQEIKGAKTAEAAIKRMKRIAKTQDDYRSEIQSTAW